MRCDSAALKRSGSIPFVGSESESMRSSLRVFAAAGAWVGCGCAGGAVGFGGALVAAAAAGAVVGAAAGGVVGAATGAVGTEAAGAWHAARSEDPIAVVAPRRHRRPSRRRRVRLGVMAPQI